jgi:hypothetical protein
VACVLAGVLIVLTVTVLVVRSGTASIRTWVDKTAFHMGRGKDLNHLSTKGATGDQGPGCVGIACGEPVGDFGDGVVLFCVVHSIRLGPGHSSVHQPTYGLRGTGR